MRANNNDTTEPLVSVLVFAYNHEQYIQETIKSVLSQQCSFPYEIIVSDDCSTDTTKKIILSLQSEYPELIKTIFNEKNVGLNKTFENAVNHATGEYIALLGGDDFWVSRDKLELQVSVLTARSEVAYVHSEFMTLNEENGKIKNHCNRNWHSRLTRISGIEALGEVLADDWSGYPCASSSCFRKDYLLKGMQTYPEILNYGLVGEGTIIHCSMILSGGLYAFIEKPTILYRIRKKSLSHHTSNIDQFAYVKKYFLLRMRISELLGLPESEKRHIMNRGLHSLLHSALGLNVVGEFAEAMRGQCLSPVMSFYFRFVMALCRFRFFRIVFRVVFKGLHAIRRIAGLVFSRAPICRFRRHF